MTAKRETRSRHLNSFNIFLMNHKHEFSKMTPIEQDERRHNKSPRSFPNSHRVNYSNTLFLQRRANKTTHKDVLLTSFIIMRNDYRDLEVNIFFTAWNNRDRFLSTSLTYLNAELNDRVQETSNAETQLIILIISW